MSKVHPTPWWWAGAGALALTLLAVVVPLSPSGAVGAATALLLGALLVARGLTRSGASRFGPANAVTAARSLLVVLVIALVLTEVAPAGVPPAVAPLLVALCVPALLLDGVDGWVARRTGTVTALGARFDMEVDALLILALSADAARLVGPWVLLIGAARYLFVAAGRLLPWMRAPLPFRFWRKVVAAACGVALALVDTELLPLPAAALVSAVALGLIIESFGRDVLWLAFRHHGMRSDGEPDGARLRVPSDGLRAGGANGSR